MSFHVLQPQKHYKWGIHVLNQYTLQSFITLSRLPQTLFPNFVYTDDQMQQHINKQCITFISSSNTQDSTSQNGPSIPRRKKLKRRFNASHFVNRKTCSKWKLMNVREDIDLSCTAFEFILGFINPSGKPYFTRFISHKFTNWHLRNAGVKTLTAFLLHKGIHLRTCGRNGIPCLII